MPDNHDQEKMRISFDLDEVLFVNPSTHKTEKALPFPWKYIYKERLREGTPELINSLQSKGFEVSGISVVTDNYMTENGENYIKGLFRKYGIKFDGIVNGTRHLKEVQSGHSQILPQKVPNRYKIALHVDDESVIISYGREYGFDTYQLDAPDDEWKEKIVEKAEAIRRKRERVRAGAGGKA